MYTYLHDISHKQGLSQWHIQWNLSIANTLETET